jgi:pyruvate dehydrogenase E2 component (dihydrolipoyllysine-residue acetyltransferase)
VAPLEFRLPDVGEGIAEAEIVAWQVAEGASVAEDDPLVEIQTDKAIVVIPCPTAGRVARLCAAEGDTIDVGALLAVFEPAGSEAPAAAAVAAQDASTGATPEEPAPAGRPPAAPEPAAAPAPGGPDGARPLAAPATRRLARELGVDLASVTGSGRHGRIAREDVERAAAAAGDGGAASEASGQAPGPAPTPPAAPGEVVALRGTRRAIARGLTAAWQEVPRIIDYREVDATALVHARERLRAHARARGDEDLARALTPTPLILRAAVRALADHPYANASIDMERDEITLHAAVHVGIATASPDGLVVPVLHDAGGRTLRDVALEVAALTRAARERRLSPAQLAGATFTVNNYGGLGIWLGTPIVRPPEVVNLGVGAIRDQVVAVAGEPVVRPTLVLAVAGDHRVLDGDTLGAFVSDVATALADPVLLLEDGH